MCVAVLFETTDLFKLSLPEAPQDPEYLGCFSDDKTDRVMTHKISIKGMTSAVCREHCSDKDALFYGTQVLIRFFVCTRIEKMHRYALRIILLQACICGDHSMKVMRILAMHSRLPAIDF